MPLFEYHCLSCGHEFEALVLSSRASTHCPACGGDQLDKLFSSFGVGAGGGHRAESPLRIGGG